MVYGDGVHFTQPLRDSYALVKVGDLPDIGIKINNQYIGKTNQNGVLATANIISNVHNDASIDYEGLPFDVRIDNNIKPFTPKRLRATMVTFDGTRSYNMKMKVINAANNSPMAPGSFLTLEGSEKEFIIGFDGDASIDLTEKPTSIKGKVCNELTCCKINHEITNNSDEKTQNLGKVFCR